VEEHDIIRPDFLRRHNGGRRDRGVALRIVAEKNLLDVVAPSAK